MMNMKTKKPISGDSAGDNEWEVRPGGMLVQKRDPNSENTRIPPPTIRVRVKYGSVYHEIHINSQATFGELKKLLSGPTGLHHEDQKLMYKDKERNSKTFLDYVGVKDKSKMVLLEDPISQEKRYLEMRKNAKMEKAAKSISEISLEVDRLAGQVSAFESVISKGGKVAEKSLLNLIELLMNQLLKLDGIMADGDVKLQRKMQVKRVQKYVETLDVLKVKNSIIGTAGNGSQLPPPPAVAAAMAASPLSGNQERNPNGHGGGGGFFPNSRRSVGSFPAIPVAAKHQESSDVLVTTEWETFDTIPAPPSSSNGNTIHPKFSWDLI
ncbi:hypothetical protein OSB04_026178 [Centaurea solstitialis]|uniref:BAG family molecular chaperone regulator 1 n=1 Tax=Centaurea solstitialis TaxID=347529 RepID=A0AA38VYH9_9ASTR|nr:hypothetical protein OSB04_026178 [Centaurea solstitialis]